MQNEVGGYILGEALYEIEDFITYRARRVGSDGIVLARAPRKDFPAQAEVRRLERELELLKASEDNWLGVMRPIQRVDGNHNTLLIYAARDCMPLDTLPRTSSWSLTETLALARGLFQAVATCHAHGIVHCSINLRTVLWSDERGLSLTHFVHARASSDELIPNTNVRLSIFSAPEQSGQLTAGIDQRTDLYSAGCVLYWLLTGKEPVAAEGEATELMHDLVAHRPLDVRQLRADTPNELADLLNRLLAKSPSERPLSAAEVLEVLEVLEDPVKGQKQARVHPAPPLGLPNLHGREVELGVLKAAVSDASSGNTRVVLVSGAPGSGKSRLAKALRESLPRDRYLLANGKFEQYRQQRPYSALLDAMTELFDSFLGSTDDGLVYWRERFETVDPSLRAVLVDQIPQLRHIAGDHGAPPRLGPTETQNRFQLAFKALLEALCDREHPLVLTVDDVHWSDEETIVLLSEAFVASRAGFLLLVLTYRPKEAATAAHVLDFIARLEQQEELSRSIRLEALVGSDIAALCADIVSPCPQSAELARRVQHDCHGNPLFALEVIKHFRQTGGLRRLSGKSGGFWQFEPVAAPAAAPDNVVDFIVSRIDALPQVSRRAIVCASLLGHAFEAASLAMATGLTVEQLRHALSLAIVEDMIVASTPEATAWLASSLPLVIRETAIVFHFYHDRIQQAARSLCSQKEQRRLHVEIGRELVLRHEEGQPTLFAAVEHLNEVGSMLPSAERARLAGLNVTAARAAKDMIAYRTAATLFGRALEHLTTDNRAVRFEALLGLAESRYLCAEFDSAESEFNSAHQAASSVEEEVFVFRTQLVLYQHQQRYAEAIALGLRALRLLGLAMPVNPSPPRLMAALAATMLRLRGRDIEGLRHAPDRATPRDRLVLDLLVLLWTPCFWTNQKLCGLVVLQLLERTLRLGNTPQAPMAYACFAILNHVLLKRHEPALEFGNLAVSLLDANTEPFIASRVRFLTLTFFGALRRDNRGNVEAYEYALTSCLSSGEHVFAGHTIDGITTSLPIHGFRLPEIVRRLNACRETAMLISSEPSLELIAIIRGWCQALSDGPELASGPKVEALRFDSYVGVHLMLQMVTCYLWDDDDGVIELSSKLSNNIVIQSNPLHASFYALFSALALCRHRPGLGGRKLRTLTERVARFERIYPGNFKSSLFLLRAELARHRGKTDTALDSYHRAMAEASKQGHDLIHAITCERLAGFYELRGNTHGSVEYLKVAANSFRRFGADAKAQQLASRYPGVALVEDLAAPTASVGGPMVDLRAEAVMRAAYAIAEETRSDRLADTLLSVVTTAAGAQRAVLLKPDGLKWAVLAKWSSERDTSAKKREAAAAFSQSAVRYVARTKSTVHIHEARDPRFLDDDYLRDNAPRSVLCLPLLHRGELLAVLYLENSICADVFTREQQQLAVMLGHQAAIAMAIADYHKVQIDALQAKINPHFLHNALSVIAELVVSQPALAETAILKLSKLYRYVLNSSAGQVVTLDQELAITRDYLALEACRFGDRLRVDFSVIGSTGHVRVPALILQPLVENAVRHGVGRNENGGTVRVAVVVGPSECKLRVADDGPGWYEGKGGTGFGLKSVIDRLKLLYRDDFELSIDKKAGVAIEIRFAVRMTPIGIGSASALAAGLALPP